MALATCFSGISLCISYPQDSFLDLGCVGGSNWRLKSTFNQLSYTDFVSLVLSRAGSTPAVIIEARLGLHRSAPVSQMLWECNFTTHFAAGQTESIILSTYNVGQYSPDKVYIYGNITIQETLYDLNILKLSNVPVQYSDNSMNTNGEASNNNNGSNTDCNKTDSLQQLSEDLSHLLKKQLMTDAILKCGGIQIPVHKCVLSARSSVFADMFIRNLSGAVEVNDIQLDVLQTLLRYMYSGQTDDLPVSMTGDVLFAAVKFEMKDLMQICTDKLNSNKIINEMSHRGKRTYADLNR